MILDRGDYGRNRPPEWRVERCRDGCRSLPHGAPWDRRKPLVQASRNVAMSIKIGTSFPTRLGRLLPPIRRLHNDRNRLIAENKDAPAKYRTIETGLRHRCGSCEGKRGRKFRS